MQKQIRLDNLFLFISCFKCINFDFPEIKISNRNEIDGEIYVTVDYDPCHFCEAEYQQGRNKGN